MEAGVSDDGVGVSEALDDGGEEPGEMRGHEAVVGGHKSADEADAFLAEGGLVLGVGVQNAGEEVGDGVGRQTLSGLVKVVGGQLVCVSI